MRKKVLAILLVLMMISVPLSGCIQKQEIQQEEPKEKITVKIEYLPSMCQAIYVLKQHKTLERTWR